jgi:hypothetical protein
VGECNIQQDSCYIEESESVSIVSIWGIWQKQGWKVKERRIYECTLNVKDYRHIIEGSGYSH